MSDFRSCRAEHPLVSVGRQGPQGRRLARAKARQQIGDARAANARVGRDFRQRREKAAGFVRQAQKLEPKLYNDFRDLLADKSVEKVGYGTEASFFQEYGVPSLVCGPGSIEQAHKADEYVSLEQLARCDRFIAGVVEHLRT